MIPEPMMPNPQGIPLAAPPMEPPKPKYGIIKKLSDEKRKEMAADLDKKINDGISAWAPKMQEIVEADRFWLGDHWEADSDPEWMPKPVENWVFGTVEQHAANLATANTRPMINGQAPGDDFIAQQFGHVIDYLWNKLNVRRVIRRSIHTALKSCTAVVLVDWDHNVNGGRVLPKPQTLVNPLNNKDYLVSSTLFKGEVRLSLIDPTKVIPDPGGYSLEGDGECSWIAIRTARTKEWLLSQPRFAEYLGKAKLQQIIDDLPEYPNKSSVYKYHGRTVNNAANPFMDAVWVRRMDEFGNYHIDLVYKVGEEILEYTQDVYKDGKFPFAILHDYEVDESFFGIGEAKQVIPNNKVINHINRTATLNAMHMNNTQKVVTLDSGIDPNEVAAFGTMPGAVWRSRTVDGIKPLEVKEIPVSIFKVSDAAREGIRTIMAMDEANMGQFGGSVTTGKGIELVQSKANVRDQDKGINVEDFVTRLTQLMISRVQQFYTVERYIPIMDESEHSMLQQKFFPFIGSDHEDIDLTVTVTAGSGAPINEQAISQQAWNMFVQQVTSKLDPPLITAQELLQSMKSFPMAPAMMKRIREAEDGKLAQQAIEIANVMMLLMQQGTDPSKIPPEQLIALVQQIKAQQAAQPAAPEAAPAAPPQAV